MSREHIHWHGVGPRRWRYCPLCAHARRTPKRIRLRFRWRSTAPGSRPASSTAPWDSRRERRCGAFRKQTGSRSRESSTPKRERRSASRARRPRQSIVTEADAAGPFVQDSGSDGGPREARRAAITHRSRKRWPRNITRRPRSCARSIPSADFAAGSQIVVPGGAAGGYDRATAQTRMGRDARQTERRQEPSPIAAKVVVDKSDRTVRAYDAGRQIDRAIPREHRQRARSAAARRMEDQRRRAPSAVPLQPRALLGCRGRRQENNTAARTERTCRRRLDRSVQGPLRHPRHAGARN